MRRAKLRAILFLVTFWVLSALFSTTWGGAMRGFEAPAPGVLAPYSFRQELAIVFVAAIHGAIAVAC